MEEPMTNRETVRDQFKNQRNALTREKREKKSLAICHILIKNTLVQKAKTITAYLPFQNEVDITPFIQNCLDLNKTILIPHFQETHYGFSALPNTNTLKKGKYGILEPDATHAHTLEDTQLITDLWIVPGVAFDLQGNRLGMGKGYYDQFLKEAKGFKVGVCYGFQVVTELPTKSWDIPMDAILTENGTKWITPKSKPLDKKNDF